VGNNAPFLSNYKLTLSRFHGNVNVKYKYKGETLLKNSVGVNHRPVRRGTLAKKFPKFFFDMATNIKINVMINTNLGWKIFFPVRFLPYLIYYWFGVVIILNIWPFMRRNKRQTRMKRQNIAFANYIDFLIMFFLV